MRFVAKISRLRERIQTGIVLSLSLHDGHCLKSCLELVIVVEMMITYNYSEFKFFSVFDDISVISRPVFNNRSQVLVVKHSLELGKRLKARKITFPENLQSQNSDPLSRTFSSRFSSVKSVRKYFTVKTSARGVFVNIYF